MSRGSTRVERLLRAALALVFFAWCLLLLAGGVLYGAILPQAEQWRPRIEARATQALGVPVRIGRIEVESSGWVPTLRLHDVVLHDAQQREALRLPRVHASVSPRSLLVLSLRFDQLLIDGADLQVRRDAQGRLLVAGLPMSGGGGQGDDGMADWFFEQGEFAIRNGRLRWIDEQRRAPELSLSQVNLVVRNRLQRHALRLDATPPPGWGDRFTLRAQFRQPLLARSGDWRRWSGTVYADLPRADVDQLRRHVDLPFELNAGEGALRGWLDVKQGSPVGATVDVALNAVHLKLQRKLQPLDLALLQGRFSGERDDRGVRLSASGLHFVTGEGQRWLPSELRVAWSQRQDRPDAPITGGEFSADHLDLGLMGEIAERLPLGEAVRSLLAQTDPQGQVHGLSSRWEGPLDAPQRYRLQARLTGLSVTPGETPPPPLTGRPGWRNASLELTATEAGGEGTLSMQGGSMIFPGVFEVAEVPLDRLDAGLAWRIARPRRAGAPAEVELKVRDAVFANAEAAGELQATWRTGPGEGTGAGGRFPGVLDMTGRLSRGEATAVARYLPLTIPESARHYVAAAVQGGRVDTANFRVRGDLWNFPYAQARDGEFRIAGRVSGVSFAYVPPEGGRPSPWPAFRDVSGELVFDRSSMEIRNARARVLGYELQRVNGGIADLAADRSVLSIEGQGQGPLGEALKFVHDSPVGEWIGHALQTAQATGSSELKLALQLPLDDLSGSTVKGRVTLAGNEVRLRPDIPAFSQARGRVDFSDQGFSLQGVTARALGGEVSLDGGTLADGSTRVTAHGTATSEGLRRGTELPWLAALAGSMQGQAGYRLSVGLVKGQTEFLLTSPLTGMALDLPAPLAKPADAAMPLRVQTQLQADTLGGPSPRDQLRVEIGPVVQAQYLRDLSSEVPKVLAGAVAVQETLPPPAPGVVARADLATLDVDAWQRIADRLTSAGGGSAGSAGSAGTPAEADAGYAPQQLALRARELKVAGRRLTQVSAELSRLQAPDPGWRAQVLAEQLAGTVDARPGRVHARLSRLALPPSEVSGVESLLDQAPAQVPALDIVIDDFELAGKRLGRLEVEAVNRGAEPREAARDWRLTKLNLSMPEASFSATGQWSPAGPLQPRRRMNLAFRLDIADGGGLLQRLGTPGAIRGGKGQLQGQVSWLGSPFALDYATLDGQLNLALGQGQFLKAGPGAGRLLGVLSLQSLPRRLLLDFRDVFQQGFAFDELGGDVTIRDGVASSDNLRMRGVAAVVAMEGQADLERETSNLRVVVVPEINAGAASLAYAAINPAVGLGTFVAQLFLRKPLMQAVTREFTVTGGWDDPKVERVDRKFGDPLPDLDPPAAPAPSAAASAPTRR